MLIITLTNVILGFGISLIVILILLEVIKHRNKTKSPEHRNVQSIIKIQKMAVLIFAVIAIVLLTVIFFLKHDLRKKAQSLEQNKIIIKAEIVDLRQDPSASKSRVIPYRIWSKWTDPKTNTAYFFKSDRIFFDPNFKLKDIKQVNIILDSTDYGNYKFDLAGIGIIP